MEQIKAIAVSAGIEPDRVYFHPHYRTHPSYAANRLFLEVFCTAEQNAAFHAALGSGGFPACDKDGKDLVPVDVRAAVSD